MSAHITFRNRPSTVVAPPVIAPVAEQPTPAVPQDRPRPVRSILLNVGVFALLGGVLYFGHHHGWKAPPVSELFGAAVATPDDWCQEHLVPESKCIECKLDLMPKPPEFGFCREHGVAECVIDHPELAQTSGQPRLPQYDTVQAISLLNRPENNSKNLLYKSRVQLVSAEAAEKAGIEVDEVRERPMIDAIAANGELTFDPTRMAHLSSRAAGTVAHVFKTLGDEVQAGETLALVDAAQVGQAKSQLVQSIVRVQLQRATMARYRSIVGKGVISPQAIAESEAALQEAETAYLTARQQLMNLGFEVSESIDQGDARQASDELRFLGVPATTLASLPGGVKTNNLIAVRTPYSGVIVQSDVVAGEVVDSNSSMFTVADPSKIWLLLNVRQEDAQYISRGAPVIFSANDGMQEVAGEVSWISPAVDERTRTLQVRVVLNNANGRLRDRTFGTGRIVLREEPHAVTVPREAVHSTGDSQLVFVRDRNYFQPDAPKVFHPRQVRVGAQNGTHVELLAGVLPGEVVAAKGSAVLFAQLQRSSFGAGCATHAH